MAFCMREYRGSKWQIWMPTSSALPKLEASNVSEASASARDSTMLAPVALATRLHARKTL